LQLVIVKFELFFLVQKIAEFFAAIWLVFASLLFFFKIITFQFNLTFFSYQFFDFFYLQIIPFFDFFSLLLIWLSAFLLLICVFLSWSSRLYFRSIFQGFHFFLLFLIFWFLLLVFLTYNLFFFYIFFEVTLAPLALLIGLYGSREGAKLQASLKMYFFTLIASLPFLFTLLLIKSKVNTFNFFFLRFFNEFTFFEDSFFWFTFFLAFAVKLPIMPLHLWLPEAHVEASTGGSVLLAGILLKLGAYAIFRFLLSFFLLSFSFYSIFIMFFSFFSIFIASLLAITQIDLKRLVAYSSVAHMGFCFFAFFSDIFVGYLGAFFLLFSHAFVSSSLFLLIGFLYDRYKTRSIFYYAVLLLLCL